MNEKSSTTCEIKCIFTNFNSFETKVCSVDKHNRSKPEHKALYIYDSSVSYSQTSPISDVFQNFRKFLYYFCLVSVLNNSPDDCTMEHFHVAWGMAMQTKNFHDIPQSLQEHAKIVPKTGP